MGKALDCRVKTPCIGVCSTGIGDSVCRGCKRFAHEVIHWNSYNQAQKRIIDQRLEQFLAQIVATRLRIVNRDLLQWHLEAQQISYPTQKSPLIWAYELLRAAASQLGELSEYGLELDAQYRDTDLCSLKTAIDNEFFILSEAHYQRYFQVAELGESGQGLCSEGSSSVGLASDDLESASFDKKVELEGV
ncbi:MAG: DUF1289 domain-containing protein [Pseudomonadales bacterium]